MLKCSGFRYRVEKMVLIFMGSKVSKNACFLSEKSLEHKAVKCWKWWYLIVWRWQAHDRALCLILKSFMILKKHLVNVYQPLSALSALAQCSVVRKSVARTLNHPVCVCSPLYICMTSRKRKWKFHIYFQQMNMTFWNKRNIYQKHFSGLYFCKHLQTCRKKIFFINFHPQIIG